MTATLQNRVFIITGAAAGIGRAAAGVFASYGARLALADIDLERCEGVAGELCERGTEAIALTANVADETQVKALVDRTVEHYGRLDGAFNNAGIEGAPAPTAECTRENWDRTLAVNLTGVWLCMKYEIAQMLAQDPPGGAIVNMASVAGLVGFAGLPAYVASKHGVAGLTKNAALEYAQHGLRVNAVCPGVIHTEMIDRITGRDAARERELTDIEPAGRMGRPEEVGEAAAWLASDAASFVTGHCMTVDGGFVAR